MAVSSTAAMLLIGGTGLYVPTGWNTALVDTNNRGLPGIRSIYELKGHQQLLACKIYRHMLSNHPEEKAKHENAIEDE